MGLDYYGPQTQREMDRLTRRDGETDHTVPGAGADGGRKTGNRAGMADEDAPRPTAELVGPGDDSRVTAPQRAGE
jgi:hypothetical protein